MSPSGEAVNRPEHLVLLRPHLSLYRFLPVNKMHENYRLVHKNLNIKLFVCVLKLKLISKYSLKT